MRAVTYAGAAVLLAVLVAASGLAVDPADGGELSPVPFDQTLATGLTGVDVERAEQAGHVVPRGQVFYAQYEYVVGFYGTDSLVAGATGPRHAAQFGRPLAAFVTDLSGTDPRLTDEGYVTLPDGRSPGWTRAREAWFVVGTSARTPAGPATLPFGDRAAARTFADQHGGAVLDWDELAARDAGEGSPTDREPSAAQRHRWADRTVDRAQATRDRPVSMVVGTDRQAVAAAADRLARSPSTVVVGEGGPTLATAVERAPADTTVELLPGRYDADLTVEKPVTLSGAGADTVLDGGGNGSVVAVRSPDVAVADLRIVGVGASNGGDPAADDGSAWDRRIRLTYGYGDAAIRLRDAPRSLVENVSIDTPSNGVVALDSDDTVVRSVEVNGTAGREGFMSVLPMYSRTVVEDSRFDGGRDAVYTHYADGTVVRDNRIEDVRYGFHDMHTSDVLVADNTIRDTNTGVFVMTRPTGNLLTGNDVRNSTVGISVAGSASLATDNVLANNEVGLTVGTTRSVYRHNTVVDNDVGVRSTTLLPTNDVSRNDIVANDRPVSPGMAGLEAWAVDGRGNYWGVVPGTDRDGDGVVDRRYRPTDLVDRSAGDSQAAYALSRSPISRALRRFQGSVPGLRGAGIVDPAPLADPVRPERLAANNVTTP
ncbi:NosD domain-containing protein [Halorussus halobius]|uniref:NosD domain-containing protein n=1 Tax=Halorussus halobius TaxID=1710537 RepID=UPI001091D5AA|nr:NosD domain-containing protein [Halorussus halobius]